MSACGYCGDALGLCCSRGNDHSACEARVELLEDLLRESWNESDVT